jgi:hypothetical protein
MSRLGTSLRRIASGSSAGALLLAKYAIGLLLKLQALKIRRTVPQLPEAAGVRSGFADPTEIKQQGVSVLIVGDSSAAGVGVATRTVPSRRKLPLISPLKISRSVRWRLVAKTGTTADNAIELVTNESLEPTDVLIFCLGTNDVLSQTHPR